MKEMLIGAVGIELKAMLKIRKLLIPLNEKNAKNTRFAEVRYTSGTRGLRGDRKKRRLCHLRLVFRPVEESQKLFGHAGIMRSKERPIEDCGRRNRLMGADILEDYEFEAYRFPSRRWTEGQVPTVSAPSKRKG